MELVDLMFLTLYLGEIVSSKILSLTKKGGTAEENLLPLQGVGGSFNKGVINMWSGYSGDSTFKAEMKSYNIPAILKQEKGE